MVSMQKQEASLILELVLDLIVELILEY